MSRKKYSLMSAGPMNNGNTESKEEKALKQFKYQVQDLIKPDHDDYYLNKWLKARCYDVSEAVKMYRASMAFREKIGADNIRSTYTPPEVIQKYLTGGQIGFDRDGSPVRIELYGHLDMKGLMYSAKRQDFEKAKVLQLEEVMDLLKMQSKKLGRRVDGMSVIFDMENVGTNMLWRPGMHMYLHLVKLLEDNYPEMMKRLIVINAPAIFPILWKMGRPLISEDMKKKIVLLGAEYKETLFEHVAPEQLPAFLGGNLKDPDGNPRCPSRLCQGGEVPEKYFLKDMALGDKFETATIPAGDKILLEYYVSKPKSVLRWEFKTEGYDIAFGVFYKTPSGTLEELIPVERVNSHMVPEDGSHTCKEAGTYVLWMDNKFSWTRSKQIEYIVEILANDDVITSDIDGIVSGGCWGKIAEEFETTYL